MTIGECLRACFTTLYLLKLNKHLFNFIHFLRYQGRQILFRGLWFTEKTVYFSHWTFGWILTVEHNINLICQMHESHFQWVRNIWLNMTKFINSVDRDGSFLVFRMKGGSSEVTETVIITETLKLLNVLRFTYGKHQSKHKKRKMPLGMLRMFCIILSIILKNTNYKMQLQKSG